jgi:hypothetical protein
MGSLHRLSQAGLLRYTFPNFRRCISARLQPVTPHKPGEKIFSESHQNTLYTLFYSFFLFFLKKLTRPLEEWFVVALLQVNSHKAITRRACSHPRALGSPR